MKSIHLLMMRLTVFSQPAAIDQNDWKYWQEDDRLTHGDFKGTVGSCGPEVIDDSIYLEASGKIR